MSNEFRIFGIPGSGKTHYLIEQIRSAAEAVGPERILVASFTRTAARELVSRQDIIPDANVGTLHSLCFNYTGRPEIADSPKGIREFSERNPKYAMTGGAVDMDDPNTPAQNISLGDDMMNQMQILRNQMVPRDEWPDDVQEFAKCWFDWMRERNMSDFTGLIEETLERQLCPQEPISIGFFDEVQDFTRLELEVVRMWGSVLDTVLLVGDDDQAIYGFKGADPKSFIGGDIPIENKRYLDKSYRVPHEILQYAAGWIEQVEDREPKNFTSLNEGGVVERHHATAKNPEPLMDDIKSKVAEGKTVMILATCSYMLNQVKASLFKHGIPWHNPYRRRRGDWNPLCSQKGKRMAVDKLRSFFLCPNAMRRLYFMGFPNWTVEEFKDFMSVIKISAVAKRGAQKALKDLFLPPLPDGMTEQEMLEQFGYSDIRVAKGNPVEDWCNEWITNEEFFKAIESFDHSIFEKFILKSKEAGFKTPLRMVQEGGHSILESDPRVTIGTIHSVKGGEADIVCLMPEVSPESYRQMNTNSDVMDDVARQFYVGMTRAKEELWLMARSSKYSVSWY